MITEGMWHACHDGKCPCKQVWADNCPVATVESGKWGDEFPSIRIIGESSYQLKAEPFMDMYEYGEIPEDAAESNAKFIADSHNAIHEVAEMLGTTDEKVVPVIKPIIAKFSYICERYRDEFSTKDLMETDELISKLQCNSVELQEE